MKTCAVDVSTRLSLAFLLLITPRAALGRDRERRLEESQPYHFFNVTSPIFGVILTPDWELKELFFRKKMTQIWS